MNAPAPGADPGAALVHAPRRSPCGQREGDPCGPLPLADGRVLQVRALTPADAAAEQDFVRTMSLRSRYRRFHLGLPEMPAPLLARMVDVDQQRHVALAAWSDEDRRIVADARYVRDADGGGADFALAVADDHQGRGLGRALLTRLARHARRAGVVWLHGDVLWENRPMIELMTRLGATLHTRADDAGVLYARLDTAAVGS